MSQPYLVTGPREAGGVHPRLEIRDLEKNEEQFSLFIQAWAIIRRSDSGVPVPAQHVQIGGIHGLPYERWPGDPNGPKDAGAEWQGYCNHQSILFPTWHRPYLSLLEQSISNEALAIVKRFPATIDPTVKAKWEKAARELRFPFWDWTAPSTGVDGLPHILYDRNLSLAMPDGTRTTVENYLAYYDFGNPLPDGFQNLEESNPVAGPDQYPAFFADWARTYRWPNGQQDNVVEDYASLNSTLTYPSSYRRGSYKEFLGKVAQLFSYPLVVSEKLSPVAWDQFSNTRGQSIEGGAHNFGLTSLEQPHNTLHLVLGGTGGHMMDNDYAGFDPVFFLHHCNVDRLLAFWEYIYPTHWMGHKGFQKPDGTWEKFIQPGGTFPEPDDYVVDENSKIYPYRKGDGNYWLATDTRFVGTTGYPKYYTYPPIDGVSIDKPATEKQRAVYLRTLQNHFNQKPTVVRDKETPITVPIFENNNEENLPKHFEPVYHFRQFIVIVELVEHAFDGSHFLDVYYKSKKDNKVYYIGATAALGRAHDTKCPGCRSRREAHAKIHDAIHIPHPIAVKIITDLDLNRPDVSEEELTKAISKSLYAEIVTPRGAIHARAGHGAKNRSGATPLDNELIPKLKLASANVCAIRDKDASIEHPWEFYDFKEHIPILSHDWVAGAV